jgi:hypothetical protein
MRRDVCGPERNMDAANFGRPFRADCLWAHPGLKPWTMICNRFAVEDEKL